MTYRAIGLVWAFAFVILESLQTVYYGGLFQDVSPFVFGFTVFGLTSVCFFAVALWRHRDEARRAFAQFTTLVLVNLTAAGSWLAYLSSVQLIEPAIAYTIGAGVMPMTALILHRLGWPEGDALRNWQERWGTCDHNI